MRIFDNSIQMLDEVKRDIIKFGRIVKPKSQQDKLIQNNRDYETWEIEKYSFGVLDTTDIFEVVKDGNWATKEFDERVNMFEPWINPGKAWELRKEYWQDYIHNGKLCYSYNERMGPYLYDLINLLKDDPDTRQAILVLFRQDIDTDHTLGMGRIPCSISYHFMIREGKLDIIYYMRSCDFMEHFRNDYALACMFKDWMAVQVEVPAGTTYMDMDSLHIYRKDVPDSLSIF